MLLHLLPSCTSFRCASITPHILSLIGSRLILLGLILTLALTVHPICVGNNDSPERIIGRNYEVA